MDKLSSFFSQIVSLFSWQGFVAIFGQAHTIARCSATNSTHRLRVRKWEKRLFERTSPLDYCFFWLTVFKSLMRKPSEIFVEKIHNIFHSIGQIGLWLSKSIDTASAYKLVTWEFDLALRQGSNKTRVQQVWLQAFWSATIAVYPALYIGTVGI